MVRRQRKDQRAVLQLGKCSRFSPLRWLSQHLSTSLQHYFINVKRKRSILASAGIMKPSIWNQNPVGQNEIRGKTRNQNIRRRYSNDRAINRGALDNHSLDTWVEMVGVVASTCIFRQLLSGRENLEACFRSRSHTGRF